MGKVAAIDTSGTNYARKGHDYDPYLNSFINGVNGIQSTWDAEEHSDSILVIRGLGGGSQKAIKKCS